MTHPSINNLKESKIPRSSSIQTGTTSFSFSSSCVPCEGTGSCHHTNSHLKGFTQVPITNPIAFTEPILASSVNTFTFDEQKQWFDFFPKEQKISNSTVSDPNVSLVHSTQQQQNFPGVFQNPLCPIQNHKLDETQCISSTQNTFNAQSLYPPGSSEKIQHLYYGQPQPTALQTSAILAAKTSDKNDKNNFEQASSTSAFSATNAPEFPHHHSFQVPNLHVEKKIPHPITNGSSSTSDQTLVYASTSPIALRAYSFIRPVVQILIRNLSSDSTADNLKNLITQSDEYIGRLQKFDPLDEFSTLILNQRQDTNNPILASAASPYSDSTTATQHRHGNNGPDSNHKNVTGNSKSVLATRYFASKSSVSDLISPDRKLTEEQMLQCLGCYFLAYHSLYPMLDPHLLYRHAKKVWRNMESGLAQPKPDASFEERAQIAVIYMLVALGAQECSQKNVFVGIRPYDWSICYYNRALEVLTKVSSSYSTRNGMSALVDYPPCLSFAQFCTLVSMYLSIASDDHVALAFGILSLEICDKLNFRPLGEILNEIERKGGKGTNRIPGPSTTAANVSKIKALRAQYPSDMDLNAAHRTFNASILWVRLVTGFGVTNFVCSVNQFKSSSELNCLAYKSIGFKHEKYLEKRLQLFDILRNAVEYAASSYMVRDPLGALKKLESALRDTMNPVEDDNTIYMNNRSDLSIHFGFANGPNSTNDSKPQTEFTSSQQPFPNNNLTQKTKRWFRNHFVVLQMFSNVLLYRPFPLTVTFFENVKNLKVDPRIVHYFSSFASQLPVLCSQIYTEVIYPYINRKHGCSSFGQPGTISKTDESIITSETLKQEMESRLNSTEKEESEFDDFGGRLNLFFSLVGAELTLGPLFFLAISNTSKEKLQNNTKKHNEEPESKLDENNETANSSVLTSIDQFVGCIRFIISEHEEVNKKNMRSAIAAETAVNSNEGLPNNRRRPSRPFIMNSEGYDMTDDKSDLHSTDKNLSDTFTTKEISAKDVSLIPSPITELLKTLSQLIQNPDFVESICKLGTTDQLEIGKYLLARQSRKKSVNPTKKSDPTFKEIGQSGTESSVRHDNKTLKSSASSRSSVLSLKSKDEITSDSRNKTQPTAPRSKANSISSLLNQPNELPTYYHDSENINSSQNRPIAQHDLAFPAFSENKSFIIVNNIESSSTRKMIDNTIISHSPTHMSNNTFQKNTLSAYDKNHDYHNKTHPTKNNNSSSFGLPRSNENSEFDPKTISSIKPSSNLNASSSFNHGFDRGNRFSILNPAEPDSKGHQIQDDLNYGMNNTNTYSNHTKDDANNDETSRKEHFLPPGLRPENDDSDYKDTKQYEDREDENFKIMWEKVVNLFI